jgi:hypothetical protein
MFESATVAQAIKVERKAVLVNGVCLPTLGWLSKAPFFTFPFGGKKHPFKEFHLQFFIKRTLGA